MNCSEWQAHWQCVLDGDRPGSEHAAWLAHTKDCAACRELHELADRAWAALASAPRPIPPPAFASRVLAAARREMRSRQQRRWVTAIGSFAAAAMLLWGIVWLFVSHRTQDQLALPTSPAAPATSMPPPSLEAQLADAGTATLDATRQVARDTMRQVPLFVPPLPKQASPTAIRWPSMGGSPWREPPDTAPVEQVGQTVAHTFEPVTTSTRKALNMFRRLLPPTDSDKPNS